MRLCKGVVVPDILRVHLDHPKGFGGAPLHERPRGIGAAGLLVSN